MKIPTISGIIERRMLVNYTADPKLVKKLLPQPFMPKCVNGKAIIGICLIRLKHVRPKGLPAFIGVGSENAAHRIAVEWMEDGRLKEGVYIPRRDTSSWFNTLTGGRIFPGKHHRAKFDIEEGNGNFHVAFTSEDGTMISVDASEAASFSKDSVFGDLGTASSFFQAGSTGYSPNGSRYEGLLLNTHNWAVRPLSVSKVTSSFFDNEQVFPRRLR